MKKYHDPHMRKLLSSAIVLAFVAVTHAPASAQIPVSNRMNITAGSCAGCDFSNKTLPDMTLQHSNFSGARFNRSNLSGSRFLSSDLSLSHFNKAFLAGVRGDKVDFSNSELMDATLTEAKFTHSVFEGANLRRTDLARGHFTESNFRSSDLTSAMAKGANFSKSHFKDARFDHANLDESVLDGAFFIDVEFGNASLMNATLAGANVSGANLTRAQGLMQVQLDTACGDEDTLLPSGLSVPDCATIESASKAKRHHYLAPPGMGAQRRQMLARVNRSIESVETLIALTPSDNVEYHDELRETHQELTQLRQQLDLRR